MIWWPATWRTLQRAAVSFSSPCGPWAEAHGGTLKRAPHHNSAGSARRLKPRLLANARFTSACALVSVFLAACGYHVAGRGELLPKTLHTVAIPAFGNITIRYKLTDRMPEAISREFITRTRYKVISDAEHADAILSGSINNYTSFATILDPKTSRAAAVEVHVAMQVRLVERATGKVLFDRPSFEVNERYQISQDPRQYLEESDDALDRVSTMVARQVVSAILNDF